MTPFKKVKRGPTSHHFAVGVARELPQSKTTQTLRWRYRTKNWLTCPRSAEGQIPQRVRRHPAVRSDRKISMSSMRARMIRIRGRKTSSLIAVAEHQTKYYLRDSSPFTTEDAGCAAPQRRRQGMLQLDTAKRVSDPSAILSFPIRQSVQINHLARHHPIS
jgi:hypothetical protein